MDVSVSYNVRSGYKVRSILWWCLVTFLMLSVLFKMLGYKENVPAYMEWVRAMLTLYCFGVVMASPIVRVSFRGFLFVNSLVIALLIGIIRVCYVVYGQDIFGPSYDSYAYLNLAVRSAYIGFVDYLSYIRSIGYNIDDLGYFTVTYIASQFTNSKLFIANSLVVMNIAMLLCSSVYLYKLGNLLGLDEKLSRMLACLWLTFPFLIITIVSGLKEVVFCSLIVFALYNMYQYKMNRRLRNWIGAVVFIILCLFFRTAIFLLLIVTWLTLLVINNRNGRKMLLLGCLIGSALGYLLPFFISLAGHDLDAVSATADYRMNRGGASAAVIGFLPYVASLIGPFANFNRTDSYGFMYGFALFLKSGMSSFFIVGVYRIIRDVNVRYFPLLVFILGNLLMLIVSGVTLDMRYHITYMPFFFVIALGNCWGKFYSFFGGYLLVLLVILYMYNGRPLA